LTIFCTHIPDTAGHQTAIQVTTSPNICFCTTWGKRNRWNMHWNEQQMSTNSLLWRHTFKMAVMTSARRSLLHMSASPPTACDVIGAVYPLQFPIQSRSVLVLVVFLVWRCCIV